MRTLSVEQAGGRLAEIVEGLVPGEEVVITRDDKPVATLKSAVPSMPEPPVRKGPRLGTLAGTVLYIAPDFDDIPEGFEDYLP